MADLATKRDPSRDETARDATPMGRSWGDGEAVDIVERALATALEGATSAQRWDVVAQLARELEARRLARQPNVVELRRRK